jgi:hypothetical protein
LAELVTWRSDGYSASRVEFLGEEEEFSLSWLIRRIIYSLARSYRKNIFLEMAAV